LAVVAAWVNKKEYKYKGR